MSLFRNKYRAESIRLKNWDYSADGYYFITICTKNMKCVLGEIKNGIMGLNEIGIMVYEEWHKTARLRPYIKLDEFIVMPNHVHGIIIIDNPSVETRRSASLHGWETNKFGPLIPKSLSSVINYFKGAVTNRCNENGYKHFQWQSRFYDHIIRNGKSLDYIREYIRFNPLKWALDRNNPESLWA